MIKGIGCDIVQNERIKLTDCFIQKILSKEEIKKYQDITNENAKICFLGGRFAAKEAIFKATNINIPFNQISIENEENGQPIVKMDIEGHLQISISHEKAYSIAFAIYE